MRKKFVLTSIIIVVIIAILIIVFILRNDANVSGIMYLEDYKQSSYDLPIQTEKEAIDFFLNQADVKKEIAETGKWWTKVSRFDSQNFDNVWLIILGNGDGECRSPYQCYMHIYDNGTIKTPLKCSDGWNCK